MFRRKRFTDLVARQIALFERDQRDLIKECEAAKQAYDRAVRDEAEERYGDYVDLVDAGADILADIRDHFARTLDDEAAAEYETAFNRAVAKRLPRFALELK
jgi:isocitrate dehydrogenase kinase/phosphatase